MFYDNFYEVIVMNFDVEFLKLLILIDLFIKNMGM